MSKPFPIGCTSIQQVKNNIVDLLSYQYTKIPLSERKTCPVCMQTKIKTTALRITWKIYIRNNLDKLSLILSQHNIQCRFVYYMSFYKIPSCTVYILCACTSLCVYSVHPIFMYTLYLCTCIPILCSTHSQCEHHCPQHSDSWSATNTGV